LAGLGLQNVLIGHDELVQTIHHLMEDVGGDKAIAPYCLSPLCPHGVHLFASSHCLVATGYCLEAIAAISGGFLSAVISIRYILGFRKDNPNVFNMLVQNWSHC
jgi:hypothetical protein